MRSIILNKLSLPKSCLSLIGLSLISSSLITNCLAQPQVLAENNAEKTVQQQVPLTALTNKKQADKIKAQLPVAPDFELTDLEGRQIKLSNFKGRIVVLEWFNNGCPFVKKHYLSNNMQKLQRYYAEKGIVWLTIVSSAAGKQGNMSAEEHREVLKDWRAWPTHFLTDEAGKVGKLFGAKTTPHIFIVNKKGQLAYQGAIDDKRSTDLHDIPVANNFIVAALDNLLADKEPAVSETPPYGCSIKYATE